MDLSGKSPDIEYPCTWSYQVIGYVEEAIRAAVEESVPDRDYSLKLTNTSKTGKYLSLLLEISVNSEAERLTIFYRLAEHEDIRMVI